MQTIILDIQRPGITQAINAKADDAYSRFFVAELFDGGAAYSPPTGAAYMLRYKTPGGQGWYDTVTQGGVSRAACTVSGNAVTCEIAPEVLAVAGTGTLCLQIYTPAGYKLGTWNIPISIQADPVPDGTIINGNYYSTLTQQVAQTLAYRDAAQTSAAAAAQSAEALANVYTKTQADAAFLPQSSKGAAGGVMALPTTLPTTGAVLKMAAGGAPAVAAENTDYVNGHYGTWTPVLSAGSDTAPTYTTSELYARYYRIGRLVFIQVTMRATITNAGTGYAYITGLPFTASPDNSHFCSLNMAECYGLLDKTAPAQAMIDSNHNWIQLFAPGGSSAAKWVATSGGISFAGCYLTN